MLSAFCYALYFLSTRVLSRTNSNETTLFYSNAVGAVLMLPVIPFVWMAPTLGQFALLVMAGALASFGHYLLIVAHRHAPPSLLSPFIYTQLVWVVVLGYVVFGDVPDGWTLFGAAIVIGSGLYILHRERMSGPRRRKGQKRRLKRAIETGSTSLIETNACPSWTGSCGPAIFGSAFQGKAHEETVSGARAGPRPRQ